MPEPRAVALRPIIVPAEHGGWGFLFEPIVLGLLVAPSRAGCLFAAAAVGAFFARQPLKLALQDSRRGHPYPRTPYCWRIAGAFAIAAMLALPAAIALSGTRILIPLIVGAPLALIQIADDASGRGRTVLPEMAGAMAMALIAASLAMAGGISVAPALASLASSPPAPSRRFSTSARSSAAQAPGSPSPRTCSRSAPQPGTHRHSPSPPSSSCCFAHSGASPTTRHRRRRSAGARWRSG